MAVLVRANSQSLVYFSRVSNALVVQTKSVGVLGCWWRGNGLHDPVNQPRGGILCGGPSRRLVALTAWRTRCHQRRLAPDTAWLLVHIKMACRS